MEELNEKLKKVILARLNSNKADSPIHEKYPFLPEEVIGGLSEATDDAMIAAKEKIAALESELASVYAKIEGMGLSLDGESAREAEIDYGKQFIADYNNSIYNSDAAVAHLRELLSKGGKEGFLSFLGKVLSVGCLDEIDCRSVYFLCKRLDTPAINRTFLEAVTKFYPENEDLAGFLANEYSMNYHTGEKAIQMVNGIIGVIKKDGAYQLSKTARVTTGKLASFCDVYLHLKKYAELLEISKLIIARYEGNTKICALAMRNMLMAATRLEYLEEAAEYAEKLVELAPTNDLTYYAIYRYHIALENKTEALLALENCIRLDPKDIDYYHMMAGFIVDNQFARDPVTEEMISVSANNTDEYAVPFILTGLSVSPDSIQRAADFLRRNNFNTYLDQVIDTYQSGSTNYQGAFPELNFGAVEFCTRNS